MERETDRQRRRDGAAKRVRTYRERMRAAGLRPLQMWVPDTSAPDFAEEVRRQSLLLAGRRSEREAIEFIEAVADLGET